MSNYTVQGRLVGGSVMIGNTTNDDGTPQLFKTGPNAGKPRMDYWAKLAVPKNSPQWPELFALINAAGMADYPHLFNQGVCISQTFSNKIVDGDSTFVNDKGVAPNTREGYPGHWVLSITNPSTAPQCFTRGSKGELLQITTTDGIRCGDNVQVHLEIKGNKPSQNPGVYLNMTMCLLVSYGEEILFGKSAQEVFGVDPHAQALGLRPASNAPAPAPVPQPQYAPAPAPVPQPQPQPQPQYAPAPAPVPVPQPQYAPQGTIVPHASFLKGPVETMYKMPDGTTFPEAKLREFGWTDANLATLTRLN